MMLLFVMPFPVVLIFVMMLILMRSFGFYLLGRQFYKLLAIAPAPVNGLNRLDRHKHSAVERRALRAKTPCTRNGKSSCAAP